MLGRFAKAMEPAPTAEALERTMKFQKDQAKVFREMGREANAVRYNQQAKATMMSLLSARQANRVQGRADNRVSAFFGNKTAKARIDNHGEKVKAVGQTLVVRQVNNTQGPRPNNQSMSKKKNKMNAAPPANTPNVLPPGVPLNSEEPANLGVGYMGQSYAERAKTWTNPYASPANVGVGRASVGQSYAERAKTWTNPYASPLSISRRGGKYTKKRSMKKRSMKKRSMKKRSMKKRSMKKRSMKKRSMRMRK